MRVTIIREDNQVYVDGIAKTVDCADLPLDVHAVQWDGQVGSIEYASVCCASCGGVSRKPNATVSDFAPYRQYIGLWHAAR